jgi:hypothetical protein
MAEKGLEVLGLAAAGGDAAARREETAQALCFYRFLGRDDQAREADRRLAVIQRMETVGDDERFIIASYRSREEGMPRANGA